MRVGAIGAGLFTVAVLLAPHTPTGDRLAAAADTVTTSTPATVTVDATYQGKGVRWWARRAVQARRDANKRGATIRRLKHRWSPTVRYALELAGAVYGVPVRQLRAVAGCESTFNPYAVNGRYRGLFQLGWSPFGRFSPFDPVANALSAAATVVSDHGWRQWECKP